MLFLEHRYCHVASNHSCSRLLSLYFANMQPTTPLTAARILNFEHLPRAYEGRSTVPSLREPKLLHIADLFLSNRRPHDLSCLAHDDPKRTTWLVQVRSSHNLPKLFRQTHSVRIHKPRLFKSFPLQHLRLKHSSTPSTTPSTSACSSLEVSPK